MKLNADCMIHATLEDDKTILKTLYSFGYRLGPDTDRRINKVIGETSKLDFFWKNKKLYILRHFCVYLSNCLL